VIKRFPARAVRLYLVQPHYRSTIEYADDSIAESVAALARIDNFVSRATELVGPVLFPGGPGVVVPPSATQPAVPDSFVAAMDDDLGTPAAVAALHAVVRDGNLALEAGDPDAVRARLGEATGMLQILGLNADSPYWAGQGDDQRLHTVVDGLVAELLAQRETARERRDFAAADAIRDSLAALGVEVSDTPAGPRWKIG
jgi:cysteinyl-tRNA synthetase